MPSYQEKYPHYRSLEEIEVIAGLIRGLLNVWDALPILRFRFVLEILPAILPNLVLRAVPDTELPVEARFDYDSNSILMRQSLWLLGLAGDRHAFMTLLHEISHSILGHGRDGPRNKISGLNLRQLKSKNEKRDEWEANRLAGAILMPAREAADCRTDKDFADRFFVTLAAAEQRRPQAEKLNRIARGEPRALSPTSLRILGELEKRAGKRLECLSIEDHRRRAEAEGKGYNVKACIDCGHFAVVRDDNAISCDVCGAKSKLRTAVCISLDGQYEFPLTRKSQH